MTRGDGRGGEVGPAPTGLAGGAGAGFRPRSRGRTGTSLGEMGCGRIPIPTPEDLEWAHQEFLRREPRDLFYRAASYLLHVAGSKARGEAPFSRAEAVALLLFVWNQAVYWRDPLRRGRDLEALEDLLHRHRPLLEGLRSRDIASLRDEDRDVVEGLFREFAAALGPVGAAKALHLLAPDLFPLWDTSIAKAYGFGLPHAPEKDARRYWGFMRCMAALCRQVRDRYGDRLPDFARDHLLKALDEWNYTRFTRGSRE